VYGAGLRDSAGCRKQLIHTHTHTHTAGESLHPAEISSDSPRGRGEQRRRGAAWGRRASRRSRDVYLYIHLREDQLELGGLESGGISTAVRARLSLWGRVYVEDLKSELIFRKARTFSFLFFFSAGPRFFKRIELG